MASKLLNVLNTIENDRRYLIDVANNAGYSISENANLRKLDTAITPIQEPTEIPLNGVPEEFIIKQDWVRPPEWIDCHQILLNTERVRIGSTSNYHEPYMIIMLKADGPTTTFYRSSSLSSSNIDAIGYSALLTSDGTFYNTNTTDIVHTWDTSRDIIVDSGEFPGTYRWVIYFNASNQTLAANQKLIRFLPAVEIIVDATNCDQSRSYAPVCFFRPDSTVAGDGALNTTLLNEEVFNAGSTLSLSTGNSNPYLYMFRGCVNLRNLDFHGLTGSIVSSGSSGQIFDRCYRLRHIDLSSLTYAMSGSNTGSFVLTNNYSLVDFKGPYSTQSSESYKDYMYSIYLGYNPQLELLQLNLGANTSGEVRIIIIGDGVGWYRSYIPETARFVGADINSTYLPYNWNGHGYFGTKLYPDTNYPATGTTVPGLGYTVWTRDVVNLSNVLSLTNVNNSYSAYKSGSSTFDLLSGSYSISGVSIFYNGLLVLPQDVCVRINAYYMILSKENVLRIFNALKDLTEDNTTVYNPNIKLNPYNLNELTSEELAIATDKGWTVSS